MKNYFPILLLICLCGSTSISAQMATKKVTYGNSTFTLYSPVKGLAPTPKCEFSAPSAGYNLKSPDSGSGTYYAYAPGKVYETKRESLLVQLQEWLYQPTQSVISFAAEKGLELIDEKSMAKLFRKTHIPTSGLCYKLSNNKWIIFQTEDLGKDGPYVAGEKNSYITDVYVAQEIPSNPQLVLDMMYSFWNDAIYLSNDITVIHRSGSSNKMFSITDYLLPGKKSSASHFPVIEENLQKNDFSVVGTASCSDPTSAFSYSMSMWTMVKHHY